MVQLSEHQRRFLSWAATGKVSGCVHRAQCVGPCKAGTRLVARGLLIIVSERPRIYAITDAGRDALRKEVT